MSMPKSSEQPEGASSQREEQKFETQFPIDQYDRGALWTERGSPEGLREKIIDAVESATKGNPAEGVVRFEKLPDGGYEVTYFKSKE